MPIRASLVATSTSERFVNFQESASLSKDDCIARKSHRQENKKTKRKQRKYTRKREREREARANRAIFESHNYPSFPRGLYSINFRIASRFARSRLARAASRLRPRLSIRGDRDPAILDRFFTYTTLGAELSLGVSHTGHSGRQIADDALEPGARCNEDAR